MTDQQYIQENLDWVKSGKAGCTFAAYFARCPETIGWQFVVNPKDTIPPPDALLLSLIFPGLNRSEVRQWALANDFYLEMIDNPLTGLRKQYPDGIAWVQYFGPDSPVKTRQTPYPMLMMCVKRPLVTYAKVGFKGILHLAHASVGALTETIANRMWSTSHTNTARQLGKKPGIREAAKTTFHD